MEIMILHDPRRPDKEWDDCREELERQGIKDYRVHFPVPVHGTTQAAINFSHKNLVALAKFMKLEEVCIMESDVMFPAKDGWEYFLKKKPEVFDLYLAGTYGAWYRKLREDELAFTDRPEGFHCYIIHSRYYDRFLATPGDLHIDDAQQGGIYVLPYPFAAVQRPGWSANAKAEVNYNHIFTNTQHVYGL